MKKKRVFFFSVLFWFEFYFFISLKLWNLLNGCNLRGVSINFGYFGIREIFIKVIRVIEFLVLQILVIFACRILIHRWHLRFASLGSMCFRGLLVFIGISKIFKLYGGSRLESGHLVVIFIFLNGDQSGIILKSVRPEFGLANVVLIILIILVIVVSRLKVGVIFLIKYMRK